MASASSLYVESEPPTGLRGEIRELVRLAIPIAGAQLALMTMGLVDMAILGRAGKVQLAGAGIGRGICFLAQTFAMGVAMALEPLASQALGANKPAEARAALGSTIRALFWLWPISMVGGLAATLSFEPLGVDPVAIPIARQFLVASSPSMLFYTLFLASKTYLQAHGKTRPIVIAAIVANIVNYAACTILVRAFGAFGSGLAMSISAGVLATIGYWAARNTGSPSMSMPAPLSIAAISPMQVVRLGFPIALTLLAEIGVFVLASVLAGRLGPAVTSAHQVAIGLASFTFMGALGVSGATAVRVGRAVGEGVSARSRGMLGIGLGAAVMMSGVFMFTVLPRQLAALFSPEPDVIEIGAQLLRIAAVFQLFDGVQCVAGGALRGAGDLKFAFAAGAFGYWLVGFPVALLLGFGLGWGAPGLWWGLTFGLVTVAVVLTVRFHRLSGKVLARIA
jgi:MATE family multidrug resistance protein